MPNRQLTIEELKNTAAPLLAAVRRRLAQAASSDVGLLWALRRKIYKELIYDERGKPAHRVALKRKKRKEQENLCARCESRLPKKGAVLDRIQAMGGYTSANTRLLCPKCDTEVQEQRGYK